MDWHPLCYFVWLKLRARVVIFTLPIYTKRKERQRDRGVIFNLYNQELIYIEIGNVK